MPAEVAKRILAGDSYTPPEESRDAAALVQLASQLSGAGSPLAPTEAWHAAIDDADTRTLIAAIGSLGSTGTRGARYEALREAALAMVEQKLTDEMVAKMETLEAASTRLGRIAALVGVIGVFVAIVGVVVAL